ncbi:unnamed protein product, partial [Urochloa humidicola]
LLLLPSLPLSASLSLPDKRATAARRRPRRDARGCRHGRAAPAKAAVRAARERSQVPGRGCARVGSPGGGARKLPSARAGRSCDGPTGIVRRTAGRPGAACPAAGAATGERGRCLQGRQTRLLPGQRCGASAQAKTGL